MTVYLLGSRGPEVLKIQQQLSELQFYSGPPDGVFGGGTDSAVRAFQLSQQLQVDGKVGPGTWGALLDRKSTRLNSSHSQISYAVFCLKKKNACSIYLSWHNCVSSRS